MGGVMHPRYDNSSEVKCGTLLEKRIFNAMHCAYGYSITVTPVKSVTLVAF
jgi:hypothetical protein